MKQQTQQSADRQAHRPPPPSPSLVWGCRSYCSADSQTKHLGTGRYQYQTSNYTQDLSTASKEVKKEMKALASSPNISSFLFFPLFLWRHTRLQNWDIRYTPLLPQLYAEVRVFCTSQDSDRNHRLDSMVWAEVTQSDPANRTEPTGKIIAVLKFYRNNKKIHCLICLFYQFTLASVGRSARRQGKPWRGARATGSCQFLKRVIKPMEEGQLKVTAAGRSPKTTLHYIAKVPENPKMTYYGSDSYYHKCHLSTACTMQYNYIQK